MKMAILLLIICLLSLVGCSYRQEVYTADFFLPDHTYTDLRADDTGLRSGDVFTEDLNGSVNGSFVEEYVNDSVRYLSE